MAELMVTPAEIAALNHCEDRWLVYRAAHPTEDAHPFVDLLDCNGLDDALWVLDRLPGPTALRLRLRFGAACAERALHLFETEYPGNPHRRREIAALRAYADAVGTAGEPAARDTAESAARAARAAAWDAWAASEAAAWAAAGAAGETGHAGYVGAVLASARAAGDAGDAAEREAQATLLRDLTALTEEATDE